MIIYSRTPEDIFSIGANNLKSPLPYTNIEKNSFLLFFSLQNIKEIIIGNNSLLLVQSTISDIFTEWHKDFFIKKVYDKNN